MNKTINIDLSKSGPESITIADMTPAEIAARDARILEDQRRKADRTLYVQNRIAEYPPIGDTIDAIVKWLASQKHFDIPVDLKTIVDQCMSVKSAYPKPD